ncbi:MAG: MmgE/PrpD family protein [Pirellulales bacterium]
MSNRFITLARTENQALGLGRLAIDFLAGRHGEPSDAVFRRTELFHADAIACGVSAIAAGTNAPTVLRREALEYPLLDNSLLGGGKPATRGPTCFGSTVPVRGEKAIVANCAAVREWDANGTNFGYNPALGHVAGEFGHNDFYPVAVAAAQIALCDGRQTVRAMILLDEIRGRLAEVFALRKYKIDHVVHGAIASAVVYAAMLGATAEQIESAVGMVVAHYIPYRAIRAGHQLSDSKGASAALSAEVAVLSAQRAIRGFIGPADVFRNPEALFCLNEPPAAKNESPFDLVLATSGDEFTVMGMHFKLGLYEHQSAGAIAGLIDVVTAHPQLLDDAADIEKITISIYQPAFGIIGDPAKRDPRTRQSADHSMVYIVGRLLAKALRTKQVNWQALMLMPDDYDEAALSDPLTRELMSRIDFRHGGADYDAKYPDGIPTSLQIEHARLGRLDSGLVMYPAGHARDTRADLDALLAHKFRRLASLGVADPDALWRRLQGLSERSATDIATLYDFDILHAASAATPTAAS